MFKNSLILIAVFLAFILYSQNVHAWIDEYENRTNFTINNPTANFKGTLITVNVSDYPSLLCGGERWTFDNETNVSYWRVNCNVSTTDLIRYYIGTGLDNLTLWTGNNTEVSDNSNIFSNALIQGDNFDDDSINSTQWNITGSVEEESGKIWLNTTGTWKEIFTSKTYNTSVCSIGNVSIKDFTSSNLVFGFATVSGSAPLNAFQTNYPSANQWNYRMYVGGEGGGSTGNSNTGWQILEICRNASSSVNFRINYTTFVNFTNEIITGMKEGRMQSILDGSWISADWWIITNYSFPEPYYVNETTESKTIPINSITEPIVVCFKIKSICVKLSDFSIYILKENKLIEWLA